MKIISSGIVVQVQLSITIMSGLHRHSRKRSVSSNISMILKSLSSSLVEMPVSFTRSQSHSCETWFFNDRADHTVHRGMVDVSLGMQISQASFLLSSLIAVATYLAKFSWVYTNTPFLSPNFFLYQEHSPWMT